MKKMIEKDVKYFRIKKKSKGSVVFIQYNITGIDKEGLRVFIGDCFTSKKEALKKIKKIKKKGYKKLQIEKTKIVRKDSIVWKEKVNA